MLTNGQRVLWRGPEGNQRLFGHIVALAETNYQVQLNEGGNQIAPECELEIVGLDLVGSRRRLRSLLRDFVAVSLRATEMEVKFGHPCKALIERAADVGLTALVAEILSGGREHSGEYRLNGAGFKLHWFEMSSRGASSRHSRHLVVTLSCDHGPVYACTMGRLQEVIRDHKLEPSLG